MRRRLIHLVSEAPPQRMLTLTAWTKAFDDPQDAARRMARQFPRLIALLRRALPQAPIEYLAVWERTQAGWPHLHVLLRGPYVPHALVSQLWARLMNSPIVHLKRLDDSAAGARYVAKYLTKDPDPFGQGRALRASRGFLVEPMRPQSTRECTLGRVDLYEGNVWEWLLAELQNLRLVEADENGRMFSAPWDHFDAPEGVLWLRWERQRRAVESRHPPPEPPRAIAEGPYWRERTNPPAAAPVMTPPSPPRPRTGLQTPLTGWRQ